MKLPIETIVESGVYVGTKASYWNPRFARYTVGFRKGICIMDIRSMRILLTRVFFLISELVAKRGRIFMIASETERKELESGMTKRSKGKKERKDMFCPVLINDWVAGYFTNIKWFSVFVAKNERVRYKVPDIVIMLWLIWLCMTESRILDIPIIGIINNKIDPNSLAYSIAWNSENEIGRFLFLKLVEKSMLYGYIREYRNLRDSSSRFRV